MQTDIQPKNYSNTEFNCSCGNTFTIKSCIDGDKRHLDICSNCHPHYTGKAKTMDTAGRIEKFKDKYGDL